MRSRPIRRGACLRCVAERAWGARGRATSGRRRLVGQYFSVLKDIQGEELRIRVCFDGAYRSKGLFAAGVAIFADVPDCRRNQ